MARIVLDSEPNNIDNYCPFMISGLCVLLGYDYEGDGNIKFDGCRCVHHSDVFDFSRCDKCIVK